MATSEAIIKLISEPLSKAPGWASLGLAAVWFMNSELPKQLAEERFGLENLELPEPVWALGLTLVFYKIGDWLDEFTFNKRVAVRSIKPPPAKTKRIKCHRFDPGIVRRERDAARNALGVEDGSYRVAAALLKAAGKMNGVTIANEAAKFLRSLVVPFLLAAIFGLWVTSLAGRAWLLGSATFAMVAYILLKLYHIWLLYHRAKVLPADVEKFNKVSLENGLLVFSWDGDIVASADPNKRDPCRQERSSSG